MKPSIAVALILCGICLGAPQHLAEAQVAQQSPANPPQSGQQPAVPQPQTRSGTLKEVVVKGRSTTVTFTDNEGQDHAVPLTPQIRFEVRGRGDEGFLVEGQYVEGVGVVTNDKLFVNTVNVRLLAPGKKPPAGQITKAPREAGASINSYQFGGIVVSRQADADYPEYQRLNIKVGGRVPPILLEQNVAVNVISQSTELAQPGLPVEYVLSPARGGRWTLQRLTVLLPEPLQSADVLKSGRD